MARLVLVENKVDTNVRPANVPEGLLAKQLLEKHGYMPRTINPKNGQFEFPCPFHEEPGEVPKGKSTNFYINAKTSQFYCQAASCAESGNLQILEQYFGIESDPVLASRYRSKEAELQGYQAHLKEDKIDFLRQEKGLTDEVIDRFRIGYDAARDCYVIPYLEQRRPVAFRFYDPQKRGPNGSKYWWENSDKSIVNTDDENVLRLFNPAAANGDSENGRVFICEGELKAMLLAGHGYSAVSIPGATSFKHEWARYFMHAREVIILMDNDNPEAHQRANCRRCSTMALDECVGHNPGQEAAAKLVDFFGFRGRNVVLPLPEGERKADINEYLIRDDHTWSDFEILVFGKSAEEKYRVRNYGEIKNDPPEEAMFVVEGLLPRKGRLLVTGAPKVGKSIFIENLVLSIASGVSFLHRFPINNDGMSGDGHRVLLLDRELSERSLFDRFGLLVDERKSYDNGNLDYNLYIDHKFRLQLDAANAANNLKSLINNNGIEVVVLDTAYKFFTGDIESSTSVKRAFATLDEVIDDTGVSVILTHHHRKGANSGRESANSDQVAGSFLWTGWPNGTVLLNFKNRSVADPYTTVASFVAFRDVAAPEPLLLKRDKESITYKEIDEYSHDENETDAATNNNGYRPRPKLTFDSLADLLLKQVPIAQDEFMHQASAHFGMRQDNIRITLIDILDRHPDFVREGKGTTQSPFIWKWKQDTVEETYEEAQSVMDGQTTIEEMLA